MKTQIYYPQEINIGIAIYWVDYMEIYKRSDGAEIEILTWPYCNWCSKPILRKFESTGTCWDCSLKYSAGGSPPLIVRAAGIYLLDGGWKESPLSSDIWSLKNGDLQAANRIGECMVHVINARYPYMKELDLIVPIPSGDTRRGYNQASLLAQYISNQIGINFEDILFKKSDYKPQHCILGSHKSDNIKGKIGCKKRIDGMKILLIDDTYNTGSTSNECAVVLRENGAKDVIGLMAVRTIDKSHKDLIDSQGH